MLAADGGSVRLTYTITCEAGAYAFFITDVVQGAAQGQGFIDFINCTGAPQVYLPLVTATGPAGFHPGAASVSTLFNVCTPAGDCVAPQTTERVILTRG